MITEGLVLGAASVATEMVIVNKVKPVRDAVTSRDLVGIAFSGALSWLVGLLFGASGVTVLIAALLSTIATWVIYRGMRFMKDSATGKISMTPVAA